MALNEKHFADICVRLEHRKSTGTAVVPIQDAIDIATYALTELQQARQEVGRMANLLEAATVTAGGHRAVSDGA